jgi:peptidyl-prolyl cis-trans isomerase C
MDQVKDQLEHFVAQKAQSEAIVKLRETAKITRTDEPAPAAPAPAKPAESPMK